MLKHVNNLKLVLYNILDNYENELLFMHSKQLQL